MSSALLGCCGYANTRGRLKEIAREPVHRITEPDKAPSYATPFNVEKVENRAHDISKRVSGCETIRDREGIKDRADVADVKMCCAAI